MQPFRQVGGSRKSARRWWHPTGYKLVEEGIRTRCPKPGKLHVSSKGRKGLFPQRLLGSMDSQLTLLLFMSVDVVVEDKAASAGIFLEDTAPVGLVSTLLVASVAESS